MSWFHYGCAGTAEEIRKDFARTVAEHSDPKDEGHLPYPLQVAIEHHLKRLDEGVVTPGRVPVFAVSVECRDSYAFTELKITASVFYRHADPAPDPA